MDFTGTYICDHCGEEIEIALDPSGGALQQYVEDCPVCCVPNVIRVSWSADGNASVEAWQE